MQRTTYTCDRCGHETTYNNNDWLSVGVNSYSKRDYCPTCVRQLILLGIEAETSARVKREAAPKPGEVREVPF